MTDIHVRLADPADQARLVEFTRAMARETENLELLPDVIAAGVRNVFQHPAYGFYLVAEVEGEIVGGLMVTTEWSDWRNGLFWWIQSVYVVPTHRRQGVYKRMYDLVGQLAAAHPHVCGFRLYVEKSNHDAQAAYRAIGMEEKPYVMFQQVVRDQPFAEEVKRGDGG